MLEISSGVFHRFSWWLSYCTLQSRSQFKWMGKVLKFSHLHLVGVISHCTFENGTKPLGKRHIVYGSFGSVYERVGGLGRSRKAQEK